MERRKVIEGYWRQYRLSTSANRADRLQSEDWFWAWEEVERSTHEADADVVQLLVALVEAAPDDGGLAHLGAGPIEDLIDYHGAAFVDQIDEAARRDERFRTALRSVYFGDGIDEQVVARLDRFGRQP